MTCTNKLYAAPASFIGTKLLRSPLTAPLPGPITSAGGLRYALFIARLGQVPVPKPVQHAKGVREAVHSTSWLTSLPKVPSEPPVRKVLLLSDVPSVPLTPVGPVAPARPSTHRIPSGP